MSFRGLLIATTLGLVAVAAVFAVAWRPADPAERYLATLGGRRPIAPRLHGLSFRRMPKDPDARPAAGTRARLAGLELLTKASAAARVRHDSHSLHALGRLHVLAGEPTEAVPLLLEALGPRDAAEVWSDLAAAYYLLADDETYGPPGRTLTRALDAALHARALRPTLPEPVFNLGLVLGRLGMTEAAVDCWNEYIAMDAGSGWRSEALVRRNAVRSVTVTPWPVLFDRFKKGLPITPADVQPFAQTMRERLDLELLPAWAHSVLDGSAETAVHVQRVAAMASMLSQRTGDPYGNETARAVSRQSSPPGMRALAEGHLAFSQGIDLFDKGRYEESARVLAHALADLEAAASPQAGWARVYLAIDRYQMRDFSRAEADAASALRFALAGGFTALAARCEWILGLLKLQAQDSEEAIALYRSALARFESVGERENAASLSGTVADTLRLFGAADLGWVYLSRAIVDYPAITNIRRRYVITLNVSLYASLDGQPYAALFYQNRAVALAGTLGLPNFIVESMSRRAALQTKLAHYAEARADLAEAARHMPSIPSAASRAYQGGWMASALGELELATNPAEAARPLEAAINYFSRAEPAEVPRLLLAKGRSRLRVGDADGAQREFLRGIEAFESRWGRLRREEGQVSYLDSAWDLYEEMVSLHSTRGDMDAAFSYAERGRARALSASRPASNSRLVSIGDLAAAVPGGVDLVYFSVMERQSLAWVVGSGGTRVVRLTVPAAALVRTVAAYRTGLEVFRESRELSAVLYDQVVRPLGLRDDDRRLVIIPDGVLDGVPMAALFDRQSGRYLVEQHPIAMAPSAKEYIFGSPASATPGEASLLAVAQPLPSPDGQLPALPGAQREIEDVSRLYARHTLLVGPEATPSRFLALAGAHRVIHVAAHALGNPQFPQRSRLVLAPDAEHAGGELLVDELTAHRLDGTTLVVLSACGTGYGRIYRGEGAMTMARSFLRMGANSVVASLWNVHDEAARDLLNSFHAEYRRTGDASSAMRIAQVRLLRRGDSASSAAEWGSFAVLTTTRAGQ